jgi:hypothetical protein
MIRSPSHLDGARITLGTVSQQISANGVTGAGEIPIERYEAAVHPGGDSKSVAIVATGHVG